MSHSIRSLCLSVVCLLALPWSAQAATVTFSNFMDDGSSLRFDASANVVNGNEITLGLNQFVADGSSIVTQSANDTITFIVTAPQDYVITSVGYHEEGNGQTTNGVAFATGALVADGIPVNFLTQLFSPNSDSGWSITPASISIASKTEIAVSITNSLFALALSPGATATISKSLARLTVELAPSEVPLPASFWLFGGALVALLRPGRRAPGTAAAN